MNVIQRVDHWSETHRYLLLDLIRVVLGAILIIKGIQFGKNPKDVYLVVKETPFDFIGMFMVHYITMVHFAGGVLISAGLITRVAILFQIPIVVCALLMVRSVDMFSFYSNQLQASFVLLLLLIFLVYGSGKLSVDDWMRRNPNG